MLPPHLCVSLENILIVYGFNDKNVFWISHFLPFMLHFCYISAPLIESLFLVFMYLCICVWFAVHLEFLDFLFF